MRRIKCVPLLAVSLFFSAFNFLPAFADSTGPVTIKGKGLGEIDDIVKTVTSSDFPEIQKHSLLLYERFMGDSDNSVIYQPRIFTINTDGSKRKEYALDNGLNKDFNNWAPISPTYNVIQKMNVSISPKRFGMRRNVLYSTAGLTSDYNSKCGLSTIESSGTEDSAQFSYEGYFDNYIENRNIWNNASLTVKGIEDKDVFVVVHTSKMDSSGNLYFKFFTVDRKESGWIDSMPDLNVEGGDSLGWKVFDYGNGILAVDIAAGDFDGDGYQNEILLAYNDYEHYFARVYKVSTTDGQNLSVERFMEETEINRHPPFNYDSSLPPAKVMSVTALAGDFDGDGVQEAAVVTQGTSIKVYKYNSGNWTTGDDNSSVGLLTPFKATRADLNGDGQDEIVVFEGVMSEPGQPRYPCLSFYSFERGSLTPISHGDMEKGGGDGDTSLLGYSLPNDDSDYDYKIDEGFSITAGPLTGTRGKTKLAEDIAISHVTSDFSRVFVIPTKIDNDRNFAGFGETQKVYEYVSTNSYRRGGIVTADFANETLMLDSPTRAQDNHDESFVVLLQSLPYHIDNVAIDGSLTPYPINYTFSGFGDMANGIEGKMRVAYWNSSSSSETSNVSFGLASTTETVSILGDAGKFAAGYLKFRATEANIAGNFDSRAKAAAGAYDSIMKFVTDKIDTTTTNASTSAHKVTIASGFDARFNDKFLGYVAPQYIWRYKILNNPLPSWYVLGPKADFVSKDFTTAESKDSYITFSMYDTATLQTCEADAYSDYNGRHENGNFFSYPSKVDDIEGYSEGGKLIGSPYKAEWAKSDSRVAVSFEQEQIDSQTYEAKYQKSELTKTISAIASFFGAKDPSPMPPYTSHSESFVKQYSTQEAISVDIYGRTDLSGDIAASHTITVMPFTTREGTLKVGTAVELNRPGFQNSPILWRTTSRYSRYPDPALVLPHKYMVVGTTIQRTDNTTAAELRGVRFYVPSLDLDSNNALLGGLQYKISVPVYNASFKDTGDFEVSLSYFADSDVRLAAPNTDFKKNPSPLHHIETIKMSLRGWQNGSDLNKGWAEFTWDVPEDLTDGHYYFYVQIDPSHGLTEVHESRLNDNDGIVDIGGNNEGYCAFSYVGPATLVNQSADHASASFKAAAHSGNGTIYRTAYRRGESDGGNAGVKSAATLYDTTGTVSIHAKFDDFENIELVDFLGFLEDIVATDSRDYIPVECNIEYKGSEYYHEAYLYGINYKPGALDAVSGDRSKVSDDAIGNIYCVKSLALVPGMDFTFTLKIHPGEIDWVNGSGFQLVVPELAGSSNGDGDDSDDDYDDDDDYDESVNGVSSSSGGCGAVTGSLVTMIFAGAVILKTAKRKQ